MSHDVIAELLGYRNELANAQRRGNTEKAAAVQEQIDRVKGAVEARAVSAEGRAESFRADGQDVVAAEHEVEARRYRDALTDPDAPAGTADDSTPKDRAVRKAGGK